MPQVKESPILFSAPMVRAILEGRKTVTRREVKKQAALDCLAAGFEPAFLTLPGNADLCPYGKPGDRLWVRETWARVGNCDPGYLTFGATYPDCLPQELENIPAACEVRWKPSIHMFRRDSRILLEITDVRVERLQDITPDQCIAEGVDAAMCRQFLETAPSRHTLKEAEIHGFSGQWNSVGGDWQANPWVWVVEFKPVTP